MKVLARDSYYSAKTARFTLRKITVMRDIFSIATRSTAFRILRKPTHLLRLLLQKRRTVKAAQLTTYRRGNAERSREEESDSKLEVSAGQVPARNPPSIF